MSALARAFCAAAIFLLFATTAHAQTVICPVTPDPATSNQDCANTAFVHGAINAIPATPLAPIANNSFLANTSGGTAAPVATTGSAFFDSAYCSTVGQFLVRFTSVGWTCAQTIPINVLYFGATCTGTSDDTTAIAATISAATTNKGGQVYIPPGHICGISSPLVVGNGTSSGISTVNGIFIVGSGDVPGYNAQPPNPQSGIQWVGGTNAGAMIDSKGMNGFGVQGVSLNCEGTGSTGAITTGIEEESNNHQDDRQDVIVNCKHGIELTSLAANIPGANGRATQVQTFAGAGGGTGSSGFFLTSTDAATDNFQWVCDGCYANGYQFGYRLQQTDTSQVVNSFADISGAGTACIAYDYNISGGGFPNGTVVQNFTCGMASGAVVALNVSAPNNFGPNYIINLTDTDGDAMPQLAGVAYPPMVNAPGVFTQGNSTSQSGNLLPNADSLNSALFEVCAYLDVTSTGVGGATLGWKVSWVDDAGVTQTQTVTGIATNGNNKSNLCFPTFIVKNAQPTWSTTVTGTIGAARYSFYATITNLTR